MGRTSTFEDRDVFRAAGREMACRGALTLQGLSTACGVSIGSLYHRFGSREALLAEAWLHAVRLFQEGFLAALRDPAPDAAVRAALHTPRFCRTNPGEAVILALCRRSEFTGAGSPPEFLRDIALANEQVEIGLRRFARRLGRPVSACRLALVAFPLSAVRLYLPDRPVPAGVDRYVAAACRAILA